MESVPCAGCGDFFKPRNRRQNYCSKPGCQRARKAEWQRQKMKSDPEYQDGQRLSWKKWAQNHPDYYKHYRRENPCRNYQIMLVG